MTDIRFAEAFRVWLRIGLTSFGGPAGQIALMHRLLVDERKWIGENRFLHALNYCMLLPGPEAQQLAIYIGWLLHGTLGGIVAGVLFVLPGALVILGLSMLYVAYQDLTLVQALFFGIKAAVLAVVIEALHRIAKRALKGRVSLAIAALAFVALFFFAVPFPLVVLGAAAVGLVWLRRPQAVEDSGGAIDDAFARGGLAHTRPSAKRALRVTLVCLGLWAAPLAAAAVLAPESVFLPLGIFFSKMAVVTFGGAYAVLAYVAQQAVENYRWLAPGEMLDGLGLAETTPGPLILVLQFVGLLAAFRAPGTLDPLTAGILGAALTTWVTFVPCFLWIFLGAPYVEALRGNRWATAALSAITAAVVGVILNLAIWFGLHVLFAEVAETRAFGVRLLLPEWSTLDPAAAVIAAFALMALVRWKANMLLVLAVCALAGAAWRLAA